ncbi:hypothetical protein M422DRAFT_71238 [Sphaerobolus stellatus SS14]|uniref:Uncharacterized protein n=1 Tax=Sphaerobolus stellatus (strain SS14) TaxID=990650 RepID=A0A0C9TIB8_SPHS4|nr:hypothetical protein M422DRAFT_71238 [Sphaerobolus stellatus SS14]
MQHTALCLTTGQDEDPERGSLIQFKLGENGWTVEQLDLSKTRLQTYGAVTAMEIYSDIGLAKEMVAGVAKDVSIQATNQAAENELFEPTQGEEEQLIMQLVSTLAERKLIQFNHPWDKNRALCNSILSEFKENRDEFICESLRGNPSIYLRG